MQFQCVPMLAFSGLAHDIHHSSRCLLTHGSYRGVTMKFRSGLSALALVGTMLTSLLHAGELNGQYDLIDGLNYPFDFRYGYSSNGPKVRFYASWLSVNANYSVALVANGTIPGVVPHCTANDGGNHLVIATGRMNIEMYDRYGTLQWRSCSVTHRWTDGKALLMAAYPSKALRDMYGLPLMQIYLPYEASPRPWVTEWTLW